MKNGKKSEEGGGILGRVVRGLMGTVMLAGASCLLLAAVPCLGQGTAVPDVLPYQGRLVDGKGMALGTPAPRNYDVVFRIFDMASGGALLWSEQQTVTLDEGRFSVQLGLGSATAGEPRPSLPSIFMTSTASDRYLEATVKGVGPGGADARITPRFRMVPGVSAMVARHALTADRLMAAGTNELVSVVDKRVGINNANPIGSLDVGGTARVVGLKVNRNVVAGGAASAASWVGAGAVPVGTVILWSGADAERPSGWALCDGGVVNGFQTPDLRGRFVLGTGAGPGLTARELGDRGGEEAHVLTAAEAPAHAHQLDLDVLETALAGGHRHALTESEASRVETADRFLWPWAFFHGFYMLNQATSVSQERFQSTTTEVAAHRHRMDLGAARSAPQGGGGGGGQAHPNMPPFYVLAYIVRVP